MMDDRIAMIKNVSIANEPKKGDVCYDDDADIQPIRTNLVDGSFHSPSFTLGGENIEETPTFIDWDRTCSQQDGPTFFTDKFLADVTKTKLPRPHVALLIEPPSLSRNHYQVAWDLRLHFDAILTHNSDFWAMDPAKIAYYPLGGSWINLDRWTDGVGENKDRHVSIIASQKRGAPGHQFRHAIIRTFRTFDAYGRGYEPIDSKYDGLAPYRFSVVVESVRIPGYFSEKLIDCISVGTIAIYWGAPDIERWGFGRCVIPFASMDDLWKISHGLRSYFVSPIEHLNALTVARTLRCAEDRIFTHYKRLWEGRL